MISYSISTVIRWRVFIPKLFQKFRYVLNEEYRSLGLLRKGKTPTIAKFHRNDYVIYSNSREGKTLSYNRINTVLKNAFNLCFIRI